MVNIGSLSTGGRVSAVKADLAKIALTQPVCTEVGKKTALSRRVENHWRYSPSPPLCIVVYFLPSHPFSFLPPSHPPSLPPSLPILPHFVPFTFHDFSCAKFG